MPNIPSVMIRQYKPLSADRWRWLPSGHASIAYFFQEINSQIEELKGAAARRDGIVVSRIAHKWQPIFAMLKISDMLPVLSRLEEEGAHKWTDELSRNLDKLLVYAEKIRTGLKLVLAKEE